MRPLKPDAQENLTTRNRTGFLRKILPRPTPFRIRSLSRTPYSIPALRFGPKRFLALTLFAIGMAYVESACVVYLWEILYPQGFKFPLLLFVEKRYEALMLLEFGRELATVAMLVGCALAAGRSAPQRIASFLFTFGAWDIFYYFWLRVITQATHFPVFPASLATWDILFLIPVPWTGPVYAPMIVAATMILFAAMLAFAENRGVRARPDLRFFLIEGVAFLMIFASFIWNCGRVYSRAVPTSYPWWLLLPAEIIAITAFAYLIRDCFHSDQ